MLKINLIIVAIISLSVFLTSNAFGQITKKQRAKQKAKSSRISKPSIKSVNRNMDDISDGNYRVKKTTPTNNVIWGQLPPDRTAKPKQTSTGDQPELTLVQNQMWDVSADHLEGYSFSQNQNVDMKTTSTPPANARTTDPTAKKNGRYANDDIGTYPNIISKKPITNARTTNPNGSETVNLHTQPFADGLVLEIKKKNVKAKSTNGEPTVNKSPRDSQSGLPTGNKSARDEASGLPTSNPNLMLNNKNPDWGPDNLRTRNNSAREAGSGNATGLVNAPLTPVNVTTPTPKARKSTKRKKP